VLHDWGFARSSWRGGGVSALLSGCSGTGKTTASELLAAELGRTLLKLDLSQVVSKYVGEAEKKLAEVFELAERCGAVLLLDEADALFGKRTDVSDAHDRYANIEVSYLLQRVEAFRGILVLTTNMQANIDVAFVRRLQFIVEFPFPNEAQRERIWRVSMPQRAPLEPDVDFGDLARRYPLAGGNIRNIALAAAVLAASHGTRIGTSHLLQATRREYQKIGKTFPDSGYFRLGAQS
jgi:SpoVK/Ycf46/Vps4 family AAA+-type ATPase